MSPEAVVGCITDARALAILRTSSTEAVRPALTAAVRGGFRVVELTLNSADAFDHLTWARENLGATVGAGTVLTPDDAQRAVQAGAQFLVSPVVDVAVIQAALRLGVPITPGTSTPTEMLLAHNSGAALQKLFPAPPDGPSFVRACLGPMPFLRIVPTSGVTLDNAAAYLQAGAAAVGFVSSLFDAGDLTAGRFDAIEARARAAVAAVGA